MLTLDKVSTGFREVNRMTALRICFVGDSLTAGTGDDRFLGWPGRLCQEERKRGHDLTCYNLGIRADTSTLIAARWRAECTARLPDIYQGAIVFAFGNNDTAVQVGSDEVRVPLEESLATARAMLSGAKAWKPTLFIGPWPCEESKQPVNPSGLLGYDFRNTRIGEYNDACAKLAGELGVPYLDLYRALGADPRWLQPSRAGDGIHPPAEGYSLVAEKVAGWAAWRQWLD
jgi:acyl-CoA thioesterase I